MHAEALEFFSETLLGLDLPRRGAGRKVLEIGGLDVNGGLRHLVPYADWTAIDIVEGRGVDIVQDAADLYGNRQWEARYDLVVSAEVLEHTPRKVDILASAWWTLKPGGVLVVSAACDPRERHGAYRDDGAFSEGEDYYENLDPVGLLSALIELEFRDPMVRVHSGHGDVYATAVR